MINQLGLSLFLVCYVFDLVFMITLVHFASLCPIPHFGFLMVNLFCFVPFRFVMLFVNFPGKLVLFLVIGLSLFN